MAVKKGLGNKFAAARKVGEGLPGAEQVIPSARDKDIKKKDSEDVLKRDYKKAQTYYLPEHLIQKVRSLALMTDKKPSHILEGVLEDWDGKMPSNL